MAATRRSTTTAPSRSRSSSAARKRTTTRRKPAPRKKAPSHRKPPPAWRAELVRQLGGHATDAVALALFVLGAVAALGIYSDLSGPVGDGIDGFASLMLGAGRYAVPIMLFLAAGSVLVQRDDDPDTRSDLRLGVGLMLVCGSIVGLLHIAHGNGERAMRRQAAVEPQTV